MNEIIVDILVESRINAQTERDFELVNEIEQFLFEHNITLTDTIEGTNWKRSK